MVAHDPLHGSGRAGFPHPALASGDDAELKVVDKAALSTPPTEMCRQPGRPCPWVPDRSTYFFVQVSSSVFFQAPLT